MKFMTLLNKIVSCEITDKTADYFFSRIERVSEEIRD